jgi:tetratricopeptide (TPR) repeat protein
MSSPAPAVASSDEVFRNGLATLERKRYQQAASLFQEAIELERQEGAKTPRMKFVSYLGLSLTLANGRSEEGIRLCLQAVKREFFDPDLYCNLGIVYLRNRQKPQAFEAFQKGLNLSPRNQRIKDELERYDRRGDPVFSFLPRSHAVNRLAGTLRHRLRMLLTRGEYED